MKNILVPTDFSNAANNAVDYACELAEKTKTNITLFHCFHVPIIASEGPIVTIPFEELENASIATLSKLKIKLTIKHPTLKLNLVSTAGFATDKIIEQIQKDSPDLIVMGITGSGKLDELLGSTTTDIATKSKTTVLIVPIGAHFKNLANVIVAFDFKEIENTKAVNIVVELAKLFKSTVTTLNIKHKHEELSYEQSLSAKQTDHLLEDVSHRMVNYSDSDTTHGIEHYVSNHNVDLLVMLKRKHGFFDSLLNGSSTRKMAFHTRIPLMILHE